MGDANEAVCSCRVKGPATLIRRNETVPMKGQAGPSKELPAWKFRMVVEHVGMDQTIRSHHMPEP